MQPRSQPAWHLNGFASKVHAGLTRPAEDETIWTESCHKYAPGEVPHLARDTGFRCEAQWIDPEWPFAESLLIAS